LHEKLYEIIHSIDDLTPGDAFKFLYQVLINQDKGPKLAGFIRTIGTGSVQRIISELISQ